MRRRSSDVCNWFSFGLATQPGPLLDTEALHASQINELNDNKEKVISHWFNYKFVCVEMKIEIVDITWHYFYIKGNLSSMSDVLSKR